MKEYINITVSIPEEKYDLSYGYIYYFPFTGIEEKYDEIIITFLADDWSDELRGQLIERLQLAEPSASITKEETFSEKNWNEEWEKNVDSINVNERIGIAPEWKINELKQEIKIVINPKMSFGTGSHATTRLCCLMMEHIVKPGSYWVDAGTGTGVLAILAVKLGAQPVFAFDNNEWSVNNSIENIELNKVSDKISISELDIDECEIPECDGIVANLFLNLVLPSLSKFHKSLKNKKGSLIISGILKYDLDEVIEKAKSVGFKHIKTIHEDEWVAIHFKADNNGK